MNKKRNWYRPVVESQEGIVLGNEDGQTVVMDRSARVSAFISEEEAPPELEELAQKQLGELLADAEEKPALQFQVFISLESFYSTPDVRDALPKLLAGLLRLGRAKLIFDFSFPPRDWLFFGRWVYRLLREERDLYGEIHLRGPFPVLSDDLKDAFQNLRIRLSYTAGWQPGSQTPSAEIAEPDALRDLALYGFRIPIHFYAHAGNLSDAAKVVESGLRLNEHSGFAVPAIFHHPQFQPGRSPLPPTATAYAELLACLYHEFPFYDDVFQPVAELAGLMREGGWNAEYIVPSIVRLTLRPDQGIMIFRQVPAHAVLWVPHVDLHALSVDDIAPALLGFHRQHFSWSHHAFCGQCQWRFVCGGSDAVSVDSHSADEVHRAACVHRMLFLEEFAWKKVEFSSIRLPRITRDVEAAT